MSGTRAAARQSAEREEVTEMNSDSDSETEAAEEEENEESEKKKWERKALI